MFAKNLAVVIGINQYGNGIAPLQTAVEDAKYLGHLLELNHGFQVVTYEDQTASLENLRKLFKDDLPAQITEHHRLLIYFAGHGIAKASYGTEAGASRVEGPAGYLIPQDARPEDEGSFLPMQEMYQALEKLPCQHFLLILDCCFAGAFRWASTRDILVPEKMYRQRFERFQSKAAWQVLTSSAHDQKALDILRDNRSVGNAAAHSPFATALYEALAGEADLIQDQVITATELYLYLRDAVETRSEERQTPGLWPLPKHDRGEFFFLSQDFDEDRLEEAPAPRADRNPYRGLQAYDERHGPLFFGRERLVKSLYQEHVLKHPLTIVVGASGTGKSSLVKAGLVPYLRKADYLQRRQDFSDTAEQVTEDWHILPILRPGNDSLSALAQMLLPLSPLQLNSEAIDTLESFQALVAAQSVNLPDVFVTLWRELDQQPKGQLTLVLEWAETLKERLTQPDIATTAELQTLQNLVTTAEALVRQLTAHLQQNDALIQSLLDQWLAAAPNTHALLVIDQAEELITQVQNEVSRQCFIRYLEAALAAHPKQLHCILTVRMDFEPMVKQLFTPDWQKQWENQYRQVVPPMTQADLRDAIEGPANEAVLHFEPASLVDDLINEVVQMPGALPLLSFTLSELYVKCVERFQQGDLNRALTQADYEDLGKVSGSLRCRANQEFDALDTAGQQILQNIMLRMVAFEGGELARRRVPKTELVYTDPAENQCVEAIVARLVEQRLLISGRTSEGEYVEPAHDALVRGWEKIARWLKEETPNLTNLSTASFFEKLVNFSLTFRRYVFHQHQNINPPSDNIQSKRLKYDLPLQRQINSAARLWKHQLNQDTNKASSYLWSNDPRLKQLEVILHSENNWFNKLEADFVKSSVALKSRQDWRIKKISAFTFSALSLLTFLAIIGQRSANIRQAHAFMAAANADLRSNQELNSLINGLNSRAAISSLLLRLWPPTQELQNQIQGTLYKTIYRNREYNRLEGHRYDIYQLRYSPDGQKMVTVGEDDIVRLWSSQGQLLDASEHHKEINKELIDRGEPLFISAVDFSLDGRTIATGDSTGHVILWKVENDQLVLFQEILEAHRDTDTGVRSVSISPDGLQLVTGGGDSFARIWDLSNKQALERREPFATLKSNPGKVWSVDYSPDGETLAVARGSFHKEDFEGIIYLWNVDALNKENSSAFAQCNGHLGSVRDVQFSTADNAFLGSAGKDGTIRLWRIINDKDSEAVICQENDILEEHADAVWSIEFSHNGQHILTASHDGTARLWNNEGENINEFRGHEGRIWSARFNPSNNNILATSGLDGTVRLWMLVKSL